MLDFESNMDYLRMYTIYQSCAFAHVCKERGHGKSALDNQDDFQNITRF